MCGFFSPPPPPPPAAAALLTQVIEAAPPLFSFQFGMAMLVLALSLTLMPLIRERLRGAWNLRPRIVFQLRPGPVDGPVVRDLLL